MYKMKQKIAQAQALVDSFASEHDFHIEFKVVRFPQLLAQLRKIPFRNWRSVIHEGLQTLAYTEIIDITQRQFRVTLYPDMIVYHDHQLSEEELTAEIMFHMYHECYHILEDWSYFLHHDKGTLFCYEYAMTKEIKANNPNYYFRFHSHFPGEVRANCYAASMVIKWLEKHRNISLQPIYQMRKETYQSFYNLGYEIEFIEMLHKIMVKECSTEPIFNVMFKTDGALKNIAELLEDVTFAAQPDTILYQQKVLEQALFDHTILYSIIYDPHYLARIDQLSLVKREIVKATVDRLMLEIQSLSSFTVLYDTLQLISGYISQDQQEIAKILQKRVTIGRKKVSRSSPKKTKT